MYRYFIKKLISFIRNKFIIVAIICFILSICINTFCKAVSIVPPLIFTSSYNNHDYTLTENSNFSYNNFTNYDSYLVFSYKNMVGFQLTLYNSNDAYFDTSNNCLKANKSTRYSWYLFNSANNTNYTISCGNSNVNYSAGNGNVIVYFSTNFDVIYNNNDILDSSGNVVYPSSDVTYPFISTTLSSIQDLSFDSIFVEIGSWDISSPLYLHLLKVTNTVSDGTDTIYYYEDQSFNLSSSSSYYKELFNTSTYYFSISRSKFNFDMNSQYYLVLDNRSDSYNNSVNLISKDVSNNIFESISIDTTNHLTSDDITNNRLTNIDDTLSDDSVSNTIDDEISNSLNFSNNNSQLNGINNGFFSRLTSLISSISSYNLSEDTVINIPLPNSNNYITLHSNILYNYLSGGLRVIINAFWLYIFMFYLFKFVNKLYIAVQTGTIIESFSSSGEAITNDML